VTKREVLASLTFGQRIAEDEADALASYWCRVQRSDGMELAAATIERTIGST